MKPRYSTWLLCSALALAQLGCFWATTKHEGKELREDVDRLDAQLQNQELSIKGKVQELQTVLDKATKVLQRNSADLGAEVDSLERDNATLRGLVMAGKRIADEVAVAVKAQTQRIDDLEKRMAELERKASAAPPSKTPEQLFAEAKTLFDGGQFARARTLFRTVAIRHRNTSLAPEAQYYRGETLFREKNYKSAIGEFQKVFDKYPKSRRADEALYRASESAANLKWCTDARAYLGVLIQRYPKSSLIPRAKKKSAALKKNARNKRKCKS